MVKRKFLSSPSDPFVTSDVSYAQNCGKMQILDVAEQPFRHFGRVGSSKLWYCVCGWQPSRHFVRVGCSKLWKNGHFGHRRATLSLFRVWRTLKTGVFVVVVVVVLWLCFGGVCGGAVVWWCFCGGGVVVFLWWCCG